MTILRWSLSLLIGAAISAMVLQPSLRTWPVFVGAAVLFVILCRLPVRAAASIGQEEGRGK